MFLIFHAVNFIHFCKYLLILNMMRHASDKLQHEQQKTGEILQNHVFRQANRLVGNR